MFEIFSLHLTDTQMHLNCTHSSICVYPYECIKCGQPKSLKIQEVLSLNPNQILDKLAHFFATLLNQMYFTEGLECNNIMSSVLQTDTKKLPAPGMHKVGMTLKKSHGGGGGTCF